jgi:hypothetical protein
MINLDRLITWLNQSTLQTTNNPLYQVIKTLIQAAQEFQSEQEVINATAGGVITGLEDADFLTHSNEAALLPNSRELIAGTSISFDDTVVNERTVNVVGATGIDHVVLSDGVEPPTPISDGAGNFVYVPYVV